MFRYRHAFHAGNFADVLKHAVLYHLLEAMGAEPAPLDYFETHAGAGVYALGDIGARRTRAFDGGIGRLWAAAGMPRSLTGYMAAVRALNPTGELSRYPGSPAIARALLRPRDRMVLSELQEEEVGRLRRRFGSDRRVHIRQCDGLQALKSHDPPTGGRLLAFIDPPYARRQEYAEAANALIAAWRRRPAGSYALWYPVLEDGASARLLRELVDGGPDRMWRVELNVRGAEGPPGMRGAGMVLINPPPLEARLEPALAWLAERLATGPGGGVRMGWLVPE